MDRTGQVWRAGTIIFIVTGSAAFLQAAKTWIHPVAFLDVGNEDYWQPGQTDTWPEAPNLSAWEETLARIA